MSVHLNDPFGFTDDDFPPAEAVAQSSKASWDAGRVEYLKWRGFDPDSPKLDPDSPDYDEAYEDAFRGAWKEWMNGARIPPPPPPCGYCGEPMDKVCPACKGTGGKSIDVHDGLYMRPDFATCHKCDGHGGWHSKCEPAEAAQ